MAAERIDVFFDVTGGKERRTRESTSSSGAETVGSGRCAGLAGVKAGLDIKLGAGAWRFAPAVGVAINMDRGSNTSLFAEVEFNYWMARGFVGTGIGAWDVAHGDTVAPAWLLHAGAEIYRAANDSTLLLVGEGRLFLDELGDVENNYQVWAGLRYVFR